MSVYSFIIHDVNDMLALINPYPAVVVNIHDVNDMLAWINPYPAVVELVDLAHLGHDGLHGSVEHAGHPQEEVSGFLGGHVVPYKYKQ
jgi:hypothetical protein